MVLPYINMILPRVYTCSPSWTLLPPRSPYHPSGSSQCTSPKHPVSGIESGLATRFIHDIIHVSMPFSQISPPSPSPTESIRLIYTSVSLLLSRTQGYCYHLSKFHIYALGYCIGIFLSGLLHTRPFRTNTPNRCPFHYRGLECKSRKSRNTWGNRQIWPWNTEWSRAKTNRVLPREHTGHSKHPLPTTQE